MTYRGHIKNGMAVFDEPAHLPDETPVRIEVVRTSTEFWHNKTTEQLAREQGTRPIQNLDELAGDWPADDSLDDFLASIRSRPPLFETMPPSLNTVENTTPTSLHSA